MTPSPAAVDELVPANTLSSTAESLIVTDPPSATIAPAPSELEAASGRFLLTTARSITIVAPPPPAIAPPPTFAVPVSLFPLIVTPRIVSFAEAPFADNAPPACTEAAFATAPAIVVTAAPLLPSIVTSPGICGSASFVSV